MSRPTSDLARRVGDAAQYAYVPADAAEPTAQPAPTPAPEPEPTLEPEPAPEPEVTPEATYKAYAGAPGYFMGGPIPPSLAVLTASNVVPSPATAWETGDYVSTGDGAQYTWDGHGWSELEPVEGQTP